MTQSARPSRLLHLHSSFAASAQALRAVQLINAWGRRCEHAIVAADPAAMAAARGIDRAITVDLAPDFPALPGRPTPGRLQQLARAMQGHDLVLTHGYAAMAAAMAHTMFGGYWPLPPLVHHEDDPGALTAARNWYRRIALGRAAALVVPSQRLETIAIDLWHQPRARVKRIAPGLRTAAYAAKPRHDALPRVIKRAGELWLGTSADLTPTPKLIQLLRAFATMPEPWQLVILGEAPQRDAIRDEALRYDLAHRVHLPGAIAEPAKVLGLFDLFALMTDNAPALVEAMAAGLAIVATDRGDAAATLAPENHPFVVGPNDEALAAALRTLTAAPALRATLGTANRALARQNHEQTTMISAYRAVYAAALGRDKFP
jgi:glycosyltransferase involved in cell wall biosynthesis